MPNTRAVTQRCGKIRRSARVRAVLALVLAGALLVPLDLSGVSMNVVGAAAAQDPDDPWPEGAAGDSFEDWAPTVFIAQRQNPTSLYRVDQITDVNDQNQTTGTGEFTLIGSDNGFTYNAISYRASDNYLYGMQSWSKRLLKIGQQGEVEDLGPAADLPALESGASWNAGTLGEGVDENQLFIRTSSGPMRRLFSVNVDTLEVRDMLLTQVVPNTADLVYLDGMIWTFDRAEGNGKGKVYRIDLAPLTSGPNAGQHQVAEFAINYGFSNMVFGAQWKYGNGNIGISDNTSGRIFQYEIQHPNSNAPTFVPIFATPLIGSKSTLNDGTSKISPGVDLKIEKRAPATVIAGSSFEFTITVSNQSSTWSSGFVVTDVVPAEFGAVEVLSKGCNALPMPSGDTQIKCVGDMLAPGASVEIKIRATLAATATDCVPNTASVLGNEQELDPSNNESTATVCPADPGLKIEKTATATTGDPDHPRVGDTITYEVEVENIGGSAYTSEEPAVATDDLSDVLDDAEFDVTTLTSLDGGTLTYTAPRITWTGPLSQGASIAFTFDVTLKKGGDGVMRNVAFEGAGDTPLCDPPVDDGEKWIDAPTGVPCFSTEHLLPRLTVSKDANLTTLPSDQGEIEYTVKVKNEGPGDWSSSDAAMTDDLFALLPAASYVVGSVEASTGAAQIDGDVLSWIGDLASDDEVTVTFRVLYDPDDDLAGLLSNTACVPLMDVLPGAEHCATATLKSLRTSQWKEVIASSDPIAAGTVLTYTLHFANNGTLPFDVDAIDYLSDVLDDAVFTSGPDVSVVPPAVGPLMATYDPANERILINGGTLQPGESATVTYTVTVKNEANRANNRAVNFLIDSGDTPPTEDPPESCVPDNDRPNCTDTQLPGAMVWQKTDEYETPLAGSEWLLEHLLADGQPSGVPAIVVTDCIELIAENCTGRDQDPAAGKFRVVGLPYGHYTLTETVSPSGYLLVTSPLARVELASAVLDLGLFVNFQQWVPEIPLTGGVGTYLYLAVGTLALLTMLALWWLKTKHRAVRGRHRTI